MKHLSTLPKAARRVAAVLAAASVAGLISAAFAAGSSGAVLPDPPAGEA